jgi:outer membrane protein assembly factor BamB
MAEISTIMSVSVLCVAEEALMIEAAIRRESVRISYPAARYRWFPLLWLVAVVGMCLSIQVRSFDQDFKNTVLLLSLGAFFLPLAIWDYWFSGLPWNVRLREALLPWAIAAVFVANFRLVNNGDMNFVGWEWRWAATHDQALSAPTENQTTITDWQTTPQDYPRFLGNGFWAEVDGVELETDWSVNPPQEVWRTDVGAGWSGFAVVGNYAVTQEQRGDQELVVCYRVATDKPEGETVWSHADEIRFDPSGTGALGGVGPRATPTIHKDRVYTMGATGIVNCLDARTGQAIWTHDTLAERGAMNIMWGKANSPLVVENEKLGTLVIVSVGAPGASLVAYEAETGKQVWAAGDARSSYASPTLAEILGEKLILSVNEDVVTGHRVDDGKIVLEHDWAGNSDSDASASQPIPLANDQLFLSKGYGVGSQLLQLSPDDNDKIEAEEIWASKVMKTKMGNVVIRDGFVYGLDGGLMQCINVADGSNQWKKRRVPAIGHGQIMLVGKHIVVLSESGELILVEAAPDEYREVAAMRVFPPEQVTWNNVAFRSPYLLLRNAEQAVCLKMTLAGNAVAASN